MFNSWLTYHGQSPEGGGGGGGVGAVGKGGDYVKLQNSYKIASPRESSEKNMNLIATLSVLSIMFINTLQELWNQ